MLNNEASRAREFAPTVEVRTSLHFGEPAHVLAELYSGSAMVVVGTDRTADVHGEGFGAVNMQLATIGRCPVAVIPTPQKAVRAGVVVAIDGSSQSMAACFTAAQATSAEQDETAGRMTLETAVACLRARHIGLTMDERFEHCDVPARALIDAGKGAEMLVVGNRGRGVVQHAPKASVLQGLLLLVPCPVVLIQQDHVDDTAGQISGRNAFLPPSTDRVGGQ
ncbi:hypothetical protein ART_0361 [Arthrobacter sp. PAMC 25486]|uniref:universal stress protein n=1 Tax=Arthrobacter sp. PAMC 25486 TaxID=1494608 RepID=UPI0005359FB9|nr:universal stress protein [Arthrobacter sp. PAMC 25486]AIX99959.1 hypothetical protein ART_0361 [Arthrobacter sp. PAMC 25486]